MSRDHQQYSTKAQSEANHAYAAKHGMAIIRTYADEGKSGLSIRRRKGLKNLLADVQNGHAGFKVILVFDVSRWGRFLDADESGYYEYLCRRAGIPVLYCAEQFENDGSALSTMWKGMKRAMAGEFSRELSAKVFAGQKRLVELGFKMGGPAGYGYRRLLVDQNRNPKSVLEAGQQKSIATDRIILVPGTPEEVAIVRWIFSAFVQKRMTILQIAKTLNERHPPKPPNPPWTRSRISKLLKNEKYLGNNVWNHTSRKLQGKTVNNSPDQWLRADGAFEGIIDRSQFKAAQAIFAAAQERAVNGRYRKFQDAELLQALRRLLKRYGYLSRSLINRTDGVPSAATYHCRFGGLQKAYQHIRYRQTTYASRLRITPAGRPCNLSDKKMLHGLRRLLKERGNLNQKLVNASKTVPCANAYHKRFGSMLRAYGLIGFRPDENRFRPRRVSWGRRTSNEALLKGLKVIWRKHGRLSHSILETDKSGPSPGMIEYRFGNLMTAYRRIGFQPERYLMRSVRPRDLSDDEMLSGLQKVWKKRGHLSQFVILHSKEIPCCATYYRRFWSLSRAYQRIGYRVDRSCRGKRTRPARPQGLSNKQMLGKLRGLLAKRGHLSHAIIVASKEVPSAYAYSRRFGSLTRAYKLIGYRQSWR